MEEFEAILNQFNELSKESRVPTYLDICKYPSRRFEEICSRMLAFYLNPQNEHGLNNIVLDALLKTITTKEIQYEKTMINVEIEVYADAKRIDILISSPFFLIGIENKINAPLYNDLSIYGNHIDSLLNALKVEKENAFKIILSLRKISNNSDLNNLDENGFKNIVYKDLFRNIRKGSIAIDNKSKYLLFLSDFMDSIENINSLTTNESLSDFFNQNNEKIESLIEMYSKYKNEIIERQKPKIVELLEKIKEKTDNQNWWIWGGFDLGINQLSKPNIGIESFYIPNKSNPFDKFCIRISTWDLNSWNLYKSDLHKEFKDGKEEITSNRGFLNLEIIENAEEKDEIIIDKLMKYYLQLNNLIKKRN